MSTDYHISVSGCDDSTEIVLNLDEPQISTFRKISDRLNERSSYGCMPKIAIREATADDITNDTEAIAEIAREANL